LTRYLMKKVSKGGDVLSVENRARICLLAGGIGILCNLLLFCLKISVGTLMNSIAVISDAFNNLSDTGSSLVTIIGAKMSQKKPDKEHPFGHGRIEYISSLIVSFLILLVGVELFQSSVEKIFEPDNVTMAPVLVGILCISLPVKLWMYAYNKTMGKTINSSVLIAAAKDNFNDVFATSAVILTSVLSYFVDFPALDGIVGTLVSVLIIYAGFGITMDTIGLLLGTPPSPEMTEKIRELVMNADGVVGVHDLIVHDYGPGRVLASIHAEVPDDCNIVEIHEVIDALEHKIGSELGIHIVIHMDPISVDCEYTNQTRLKVQEIIKEINNEMNIHDFRIVDGNQNINLIFDIEVPADYNDIAGLKEDVGRRVKELDSRFNVVCDIDIIYG